MLTGSLSDWPKFFKQSYEYVHQFYPLPLLLSESEKTAALRSQVLIWLVSALQPGGYIELSDIIFPLESDDGTLPKDSALNQWGELCNKAAHVLNRPLDSARLYSKQLAEAGFTNITERHFKWPQNRWPKDPKYKELGMFIQLACSRSSSLSYGSPFLLIRVDINKII